MANMTLTKRAIQAAFIELLNERTMNKITVKDITDRCGINRNTFYYHYQDITALLEEICANQVDRIVKEYPTINSIDDCLKAAMKFALENRRAVMHIYNSDNRNIYVNSLWRICEQAVITYADTVLADAQISERDKDLIIRYYKCESFGIILDWISTGMKEEYLQGIHRMCLLKKGQTEELIRRSQELDRNGES